MKRIIYGVVLFLPSLLWAQDERQTLPLDLFYRGKVVLQNGDTIKGLVKYNLDDLVQVLHGYQAESFSAQKISYFEILDYSDNGVRRFYSLPYTKVGPYKTPVFFELITKGKITVLSRESIKVLTSRGPGFHQPTMETILINKYFLLKENGEIEDFSGKRNWYELMGNQADEVQSYVKSNKLDFHKKHQLKSIIDYYNSSPNKQSIFSSAKTPDLSIQR